MTATNISHKVLVLLPERDKPAFAVSTGTPHPIEWVEATSLEEAARMLRELEFDFTVIDADNPSIDYRKCIHFVKSTQPKARVVVAAEIGDDEMWLDALDAGACDLVEKPIDGTYLERLCHRAASRAAAA
ncbi:MAG: response regulator [Candidatus Hydrogenedentota bacterium]|jgi:DNA-binding NtrC family response regulator|nr:MAG: response regulator [Candidatus Hydrogenedentota bacterium]GIX44153.1 MAG: hypothetical protein KatS3mg130_0561 [Candidatus Sumerlaea sp.]